MEEFLPFGDGLQDDNFDPNFDLAPFHVNLKRDGLQDDNFDPNFDRATSHFNLKRDGLQDDNFDPNFDPAPSHFNLKQDGLQCHWPFLAKSWPGTFWKHISAIWRRSPGR